MKRGKRKVGLKCEPIEVMRRNFPEQDLGKKTVGGKCSVKGLTGSGQQRKRMH
jgi:hypothetical protein